MFMPVSAKPSLERALELYQSDRYDEAIDCVKATPVFDQNTLDKLALLRTNCYIGLKNQEATRRFIYDFLEGSRVSPQTVFECKVQYYKGFQDKAVFRPITPIGSRVAQRRTPSTGKSSPSAS